MKKTKTILIALLLCIALLFSGCMEKPSEKTQFDEWSPEGVIQEIVSYVEDVTDRKSKNFIPEEDRIAVFDLDGTLMGEQAPIYYEWMLYSYRVLEDPDCEATQEMRDLAAQILHAGIEKSIPENIEEDESLAFGQAFDGMPVDTYKEYLKAFMEYEVDGFDGLTYKESYFRPMVQILEYLDENDFVIYIVSGTDRDLDRITMDYFYHIPYYQIIGTDCYNEGSHHDDVNYLEYHYDADEVVMRDSTRIVKNVKSGKIMQIYQEIGQRPVMAFGNSGGDESMFSFTAQNEKYKTAVFCLIPDDDVREYANLSKAEKLTAMCGENGYHVISMKNDFLTIYGDNVTKKPDKMDFTEKLLDIYEKSN